MHASRRRSRSVYGATTVLLSAVLLGLSAGAADADEGSVPGHVYVLMNNLFGENSSTTIASCWMVLTNNRHLAYTSDADSHAISGHRVHANGTNSLVDPAGVTGTTRGDTLALSVWPAISEIPFRRRASQMRGLTYRRSRWVAGALVVMLGAGPAVVPAWAQADGRAGQPFSTLQNLTGQLDAALSDPSLFGVAVGLSVRSAETGDLLYDHNGEVHLPAASIQKLLTSAAALAQLGPDYRFHTSVLVLTEPTGEVVSGDLYLRGTGDPTLLPSRYDELATAVAARGVHEVRGSLVADDTWFDANRLGTDWSQQDENFAYAAPVSALSVSPDADFNTGSVQVDIAPGVAVGAPADVGLTPPTSAMRVDNRITTGAPGSARQLSAVREHGTDRIVVAGTMPLDGRPAHPLRSVSDPTTYAADVFRSALTRHDVKVLGQIRSGATPSGAFELAGMDSIPLRDLMVPFLKLSNNEIAEILVKAMGRSDAGEGSWDAGLRVVRRYVATSGVDPEHVQLVDGSGLSTSNLVAPDAVTALLVAVQGEPWFDAWYAALPIAGESEHLVGGTLADRMVGTAAASNLHGKSGSLSATSALSGYVTTAAGERLVFSLVENGFIGSPPKVIEDAVAVTLAELSDRSSRSVPWRARSLETTLGRPG